MSVSLHSRSASLSSSLSSDAHHKIATSLFESLDSDNDGILSTADLHSFIEDGEKLVEILLVLDPLHTGNITKDIFVQCFASVFNQESEDSTSNNEEQDESSVDNTAEAAEGAGGAGVPPHVSQSLSIHVPHTSSNSTSQTHSRNVSFMSPTSPINSAVAATASTTVDKSLLKPPTHSRAKSSGVVFLSAALIQAARLNNSNAAAVISPTAPTAHGQTASSSSSSSSTSARLLMLKKGQASLRHSLLIEELRKEQEEAEAQSEATTSLAAVSTQQQQSQSKEQIQTNKEALSRKIKEDKRRKQLYATLRSPSDVMKKSKKPSVSFQFPDEVELTKSTSHNDSAATKKENKRASASSSTAAAHVEIDSSSTDESLDDERRLLRERVTKILDWCDCEGKQTPPLSSSSSSNDHAAATVHENMPVVSMDEISLSLTYVHRALTMNELSQIEAALIRNDLKEEAIPLIYFHKALSTALEKVMDTTTTTITDSTTQPLSSSPSFPSPSSALSPSALKESFLHVFLSCLISHFDGISSLELKSAQQDRLLVQVTELKETIRYLTSEHQSVLRHYNLAVSTTRKLETENDLLRQAKLELSSKLSTLLNENSEGMESISLYRQHIQTLSQERNTFKQQLLNAQEEHHHLLALVNLERKQMKQLKEELKETKSLLHAMQSSHSLVLRSSFATSLEKMREQLDYQRYVRSLQTENAQLQQIKQQLQLSQEKETYYLEEYKKQQELLTELQKQIHMTFNKPQAHKLQYRLDLQEHDEKKNAHKNSQDDDDDDDKPTSLAAELNEANALENENERNNMTTSQSHSQSEKEEEMKKQQADLQVQLSALEENYGKLFAELTTERDKTRALQHNHLDLSSQLAIAVNNLKTSAAQHEQQIRDKDTEHKNTQTKLASLTFSIAALTADVESKSKEIETLRSQLSAAQTTVEKMEVSHTHLQEEYHKCSSALQLQLQLVDSLKLEGREEREKYSSEMSLLQSQLVEMNSKWQSLQTTLASQEHTRLNSLMQSLDAANSQLDQERVLWQTEREKLREQLSRAEKKKQEEEEEAKLKAAAALQAVEKLLAERDASLLELQKKLQELERWRDTHVCFIPTTSTTSSSNNALTLALTPSASEITTENVIAVSMNASAMIGSTSTATTTSNATTAEMLKFTTAAPTISSSSSSSSSSSTWSSVRLTSLQLLEASSYAVYLDNLFSGDVEVSHLLPLAASSSSSNSDVDSESGSTPPPPLLPQLRDGILICKLINHVAPGLIDMRALNTRRNAGGNSTGTANSGSGNSSSSNEVALDWRHIVENVNLAISTAKAMGISMRLSSTSTNMQTITSSNSEDDDEEDDDDMNDEMDTFSLLAASSEVGAAQLQLLHCTDVDAVLDFIFQLLSLKYMPSSSSASSSSSSGTGSMRMQAWLQLVSIPTVSPNGKGQLMCATPSSFVGLVSSSASNNSSNSSSGNNNTIKQKKMTIGRTASLHVLQEQTRIMKLLDALFIQPSFTSSSNNNNNNNSNHNSCVVEELLAASPESILLKWINSLMITAKKRQEEEQQLTKEEKSGAVGSSTASGSGSEINIKLHLIARVTDDLDLTVYSVILQHFIHLFPAIAEEATSSSLLQSNGTNTESQAQMICAALARLFAVVQADAPSSSSSSTSTSTPFFSPPIFPFLRHLLDPLLFEQQQSSRGGSSNLKHNTTTGNSGSGSNSTSSSISSSTITSSSGFERMNIILLALLFEINCNAVEKEITDAAAKTASKSNTTANTASLSAASSSSSSSSTVAVENDNTTAIEVEYGSASSSSQSVSLSFSQSPELRELSSVRNWLSCLGVGGLSLSSSASSSSAFTREFKDGVILLKIADKLIEGGCVDWRKVEKKPDNKFKCISNCNYFIALATSPHLFGFSLVGVGGVDIYDGHVKYLLSILAQLMRFQTMKKLKDVKRKMSKFRQTASSASATSSSSSSSAKNQEINDEAILVWANQKVSSHLHPVVSTHHSGRISSLHDSSLSHSLYLFNLLHSIKTNLVQWHLVELPQTHNPTDSEAATNTTTTTTSTAAAAARMSGMSVESRVSNARYFLSLARKLGADLFCTPLDILECKQNSILLILATLMTIDMEMNSNN